MRRLVLIATTLLIVFAGPAWAWNDDAEKCYKATERENITKSERDNAITACNRALGSKNLTTAERASTFSNRGLIYGKKGEHDRAITDYNEALRLKPDHAPAFANRGSTYHEKGEHDRAIADYNEALRLKPDYAFAFRNRGRAYGEKGGEYDRAIADLNEAIRLKPDYAYAFASRGWAYNEKGEHDRAIADLNEALRLKPDNFVALNNRGYAYSGKGEHDRAIADYNEALRLKPDHAPAFANRGWAYTKKGEYDRAIADLNEAIRLKPDYAKAFASRGVAYRDKGDLPRAVKDFRQALALAPNYEKARNSLAEVEKRLATVAPATPPPRDLVERVQRHLNTLGFAAGSADGIVGRRTRDALVAFQQGVGLPPDGEVSETVLARLDRAVAEAAKAPPPAPTPDTTPPVLLVAAERVEIEAEEASIEGTVADDHGPTRLFLDGHGIEVGPGGRFRTTVAVAGAGTHHKTLRAEDAAGNRAERTVTIVRRPPPDTVPPVITVAERLETEASWLLIEGTVTDNSGQISWLSAMSTVEDRQFEPDRNGRFHHSLAVPRGESPVTLRAGDAAGNVAEAIVTAVRRPPLEPQVAAVEPVTPTTEPEHAIPAVGSTTAAGQAALEPPGTAALSAERRVALVIGNGAYRHEAALPNPANDARAVAAALRRLGFEVSEGVDLNRGEMEDILLAFAREAETADDALVFYAGHGIQVDGRNYLLPIDAQLADERDLRRYPTADQVIVDAAGARRVALVILDACRDSPFARSLVRRMGTRSAEVRQGLAPPTLEDLPRNTLIAYATAANAVAADGTGAANSPFTTALLRFMDQPGLEVRFLFGEVRDAVFEATGGKQVPFIYGSLGREPIYLASTPG